MGYSRKPAGLAPPTAFGSGGATGRPDDPVDGLGGGLRFRSKMPATPATIKAVTTGPTQRFSTNELLRKESDNRWSCTDPRRRRGYHAFRSIQRRLRAPA